MQRAYDNVIHDVALQQLKVVFCLDRAGLVGEDGATHQGVFDMAAFRPIPGLAIASPLNELELRMKRKYSFSDRCRYYMPTPAVEAAADRLISNLRTHGVPLNLLSQFMPIQYTKVREGELSDDPVELLEDRIVNTIDEYLYATHQRELL